MREIMKVEKFYCAVDHAASPIAYRGFFTKPSALEWIKSGPNRQRCQFPTGHPTEAEVTTMRSGSSVALTDGEGWPTLGAAGTMYVGPLVTTMLVFDES